MPKSKRSQLVTLTQTDKRGTRDHKTKYIQEVRDAVDAHDSLFLFSFENMRSNKFKGVRMHFRDEDDMTPSRIMLGKNKLLQIALGRSEEEEYAENLHHVAKRISGGSVGLLFTSRSKDEVIAYFRDLEEPDFARAGFVATYEVIVKNEMMSTFPASMMEQLRKLGVPVEISDGKVVLQDKREKWRLCAEGETLSAEKCKVLTHFNIQMAHFKVDLVCYWSDGEFQKLQ